MPVEDYAHWNEEAELIWWLEEGRHPYEPEFEYDDDPYDPDADNWDEDDEDDDDSTDYAGPEDLGWDGGLEA